MEIRTISYVKILVTTFLVSCVHGQQQPAVPNFRTRGITYYCKAYVDLVLVVDSSVFSTYTTLNGITSWHPGLSLFLTNLVQTLQLDSSSFRVAIILYSTDIDDILTFTVQKVYALNGILKLIPRYGSRTRTDRGLAEMRKLLTYYGRSGAGKRAVLISGSPSENPELTLNEAKLIKNLGIDLISVGFGPYRNPPELHNLSPGSVLEVGDAGMLYALVGRLAARLCVEPVHGGWTPWTRWSQCSRSCDGGVTRRFRFCTNPAPKLGGNACVGPSVSSITCNNRPCLSFFMGSYWSMWSSCSSMCGMGTQTRTRSCVEDFNKARCNEAGQEISRRQCFSGPCAVNGGWTSWSSWTKCSVTCGDGTRQRTRECTNPVPSPSGRNCVGDDMETIPCFTLQRCMDCGDCMWNPGARYLGCNDDCAKYVQCTEFGRTSIEQYCPHGLLWSSSNNTCVQPELSECSPCKGKQPGSEVSYSASCREYWKCRPDGSSELRCCGRGFVFISGVGCVTDYTKTCVTECSSDIPGHTGCTLINVTFTSLSDTRGVEPRVIFENVRYLSNGGAFLSTDSFIVLPMLADIVWSAPLSIKLKLQLYDIAAKGQNTAPQAILHNAGCRTKDKPTVLFAIDFSKDFLVFTFGVVLESDPEMLFFNITSKKSGQADLLLQLLDNSITAEVNGRKSTVQFGTDETIAKTTQDLQVGGRLCDLNYEPFSGIVNEIIVDKCASR